MDNRLTIKSEIIDGHYTLICMRFCGGRVPDDGYACYEYCGEDGSCEKCGIQQSFDRLAAYEDTGLTPEEITTLIADNENLHRLVDVAQKILWSSDTEEQE